MASNGFTPLERRALLALISLMRDRNLEDAEDCQYWEVWEVPIRQLYERCYVLAPGKSYELQCRNQRQAMRRALERLRRQDLVHALALGWCVVGSGDMLRWQGGGKRDDYSDGPPNWRLVGLTDNGIKVALAIEREGA